LSKPPRRRPSASWVEQGWLRRTEDFGEGIKAYAERRLPNFQGR
jgi:hypothetical protein